MATKPVRRINLALQGGGAHGAFTWGVLDRILQDETVEIAAISGTSAGALNGAALKSGLVEGGRDGARAKLDWLWVQVGAIQDMRLAQWMTAFFPLPGIVSRVMEFALPFSVMDTFGRNFSPYDYGPFYSNPLQRIVQRFNFDTICAREGPAFFVSATNVRTGKIRVFSGNEVSTDVILASACLPTVFQALEFTDPRTGKIEAFWDGGYTGNPALFPLFDPALPKDVVIVNINPLIRDEVPGTMQQIQNRINEISFNSSLLRELRAIHFVKRLIAEGTITEHRMKDMFIHMIADDGLMTKLSVATKLVPTPTLLWQLKEAGRAAADAFLSGDGKQLNKSGSVDLVEMFS